MKRITLTLLALLSVNILFAQAPQSFKYQAVARDNAGEIINNQLVSFRISILQGSASGTSIYSETHQLTTNDFGLANLEIGVGSVVSGNFGTVNWSAGSYFLRVEMDPAGGSTYQLMGSSQLLSVPYALFSENTANPGDNDWTISGSDMYSGVTGNVGIGTSTPDAKLEVAGHISVVNTGESVFLGENAGTNDNLSTNHSVFIGYNTGASNISGNRNTALGAFALHDNETGSDNTSLGEEALYNNISGSFNTAIGTGSLHGNTLGTNNVAIGWNAAAVNPNGTGNTAVGTNSLRLVIFGSNNTVLGHEAGYGTISTSLSGSVFLGYQAGKNETTSNKLYIENSESSNPLIYGEFDNDIVAINGHLGVGTSTPEATLDVWGRIAINNTGGSVFIGDDAGLNDDLSTNANVFIGDRAGMENTTGYANIACGLMSMFNNTTGFSNSAIGVNSLLNNNTGTRNTAIGRDALKNNTTGSSNTVIGHSAMNYTLTGNYNTAVGVDAGYGSTSVSRNGCVYLGYQAGYYNNSDNKLFIDNSNTSTPLIYGDFSSNILSLNGSVGFGTITPSVKAHIVGGTDASLTSGGYLVTGYITGENIVLDENEIMARNNGGTSSLQLQRDGGSLSVHYGLGELNEFRIRDDGKTGIGENLPTAKLHINTNATEDALRIQVEGTTKFKIASNGGVALSNATAPAFALELQNSSIDLIGRARAYSWNTYSDNRLKSNQRELEYGLNEVMQLHPKSYDHHSSSTSEVGEFIMVTNQKEATIGFIAQEVEKIIPEAVSVPKDDSQDLWSMDYSKLIPVLTRAIQEQQAIIEDMKLEIEVLKNQSE